MSWVIFVAPENTSQADTIIVGPFNSPVRADMAMEKIERLYDNVACMVMETFPPKEIPTMFLEDWEKQ